MDQNIPVTARRYFDFSAGDGRFSEILRSKNFHIAGQVDIHPRSDAVSKEDFLSLAPKTNIDIIGLNPPFGKQGTMAKEFVRRVVSWNAAFMVLILPARLRGTFWVDNYRVLHTRSLPPKSFYRPGSKKRLTVPTSLWVLQRTPETVAKLATYVRPNLRTPEGVILLPRTRQWNSRVNLMVRTMGVRAGRDILFLQGQKWHVVRNGILGDEEHETPFTSGWRLTVRPCGADFALIQSSWTDPTLLSFIQYLLLHPDLHGKQCQPPTMRRSWLAKLFREFHE